MKLTIGISYEVTGEDLPTLKGARYYDTRELMKDLRRVLRGTVLDAANAQLEAENKKLRLKLVDVEVE